MEVSARSLTNALGWIEDQLTALEARARSKNTTVSQANVIGILTKMKNMAGAEGVDAETWRAVHWAVLQLEEIGVRIAKGGDGTVNLANARLLYGRLPEPSSGAEAPGSIGEDDFAAILK